MTTIVILAYLISAMVLLLGSYLYSGRLFQTGWWMALVPFWNIVLMITFLTTVKWK